MDGAFRVSLGAPLQIFDYLLSSYSSPYGVGFGEKGFLKSVLSLFEKSTSLFEKLPCMVDHDRVGWRRRRGGGEAATAQVCCSMIWHDEAPVCEPPTLKYAVFICHRKLARCTTMSWSMRAACAGFAGTIVYSWLVHCPRFWGVLSGVLSTVCRKPHETAIASRQQAARPVVRGKPSGRFLLLQQRGERKRRREEGADDKV
jgi:hypothetical protein